MKKKKSVAKKFKYVLLTSASALALAFAVYGYVHDEPQQVQNIPTDKDLPTVVTDIDPFITISYNTDTLASDTSTSTLLYYKKYTKQITRNYVDKNERFRIQLPYFFHEVHHDYNKFIPYMTKWKYSPEQYAMLRMHEEISANVASVLAIDLEYQAATDKSAVIKKYENSDLRFYINAIKKKIVNPESTDSTELNKKYDFIVNATIDMWQNTFTKTYSKDITDELLNYMKNVGLFTSFNQNYHMVLSHMYTFGGIDFSKYIRNDVKFPDPRIKILNEMAYTNSFTKSKSETAFLVDYVWNNFETIQNLGLYKQGIALQHLMVSAKLKYELKKLDNYNLAFNSMAITAAYNKVMYELSHDISFERFINNCTGWKTPYRLYFSDHNMFHFTPYLPEENFSKDNFEPNTLSKLYMHRDTDLRAYIKKFNSYALPLDYSSWIEFNCKYFCQPSIEQLIIRMPSLDGETKEEPKPKEVHHYSGDINLKLLDLTKPILSLKSLPEKTQKEIIEYFKAFDEINDVFKGCDTKKIEEYMKKNNVPHPFADKKPDEQTNVLQNGNKVKSDSIQKKDLKTKQKTVHYASAKKKSVTTNKKTARHTSAQKNNLALLKTRQKNRH